MGLSIVTFSGNDILNVVFKHKRESKQLIKNYRTVSQLPVYVKIMERLIYDAVYPCLFNKNLISSHQSSLKTCDSIIKQLLSMMYEIYKPFDEGF